SNTITSEVLTGVTSGAGMFVAVGNKATILTSNDGVNWMQQASGMNPSTHDFDEIIYDGTKFIAVTRNTLDIVTSTDGVNWNKESGAVGSITYGNGKYLSGSDEIRTSNDGVNWTTSTPLSSLGVTSGITNMLWTGDK